MTIYSIRSDGYDYQELDLEVGDIIEYFPEDMDYNTIHDFSLNNLSLATYWKPVRTGFSTIKGKKNIIPDISNWINATLVLSPKAYRLLGELLSPFGEFLPVLIEDEIFYIFNCLTLVDLTDSASTSGLSKNTNEKLIFKSTQDHCIDIYCTERLKNAIQDFGLQGVVFNAI